MSEKLKMRPYARLITMLGDQLIKNERIALSELIKNAYDADAEWVKVSFVNFNDDFTVNDRSKIIIEDNGCGMNREIIEKHWLNPATPEKAKRKQVHPQTEKGRIIQGEKGIGRFAAFKLGQKIDIYTRRQLKDENGMFTNSSEPMENHLSYDFSLYNEDFIDEADREHDLFIDELEVDFEQQKPTRILDGKITLGGIIKDRKSHGTIIEISALKTNWTEYRIELVRSDIEKLQPIFTEEGLEDFSAWIYKDNEEFGKHYVYKSKLLDCLANKSVLKITDGYYIQSDRKFIFRMNGVKQEISFKGLSSLDAFRNYFCDSQKNPDILYQTECGDFSFQFYVFDFNALDEKYKLDSEEIDLVKEHRVYLYRDHIRVLPFGDPDDDWLKIDMLRGTKSAAYYLSNDQIVGCIDISQAKNPNLRDKTNREGLIDEGQAVQDFINLLRVFLRYIRKVEYARYLIDKRRKKEAGDQGQGKTFDQIQEIKKKVKNDTELKSLLNLLERKYLKEVDSYKDKIRVTENLAAVGLSVETASHDVMIIMEKVLDQIQQIKQALENAEEIDRESLKVGIVSIEKNMDMIYKQMNNIRLLFPAAKKRATNISVEESLNKVYQLYQSSLDKNNISVDVIYKSGNWKIKATEAVLLQVFVNLFDNSLYWLKEVNVDRLIKIIVDDDEESILFSDTGPGIEKGSRPYIFEAFYSEKGEDGKGLGLYIARQLLNRYDYNITLITDENKKILPGANFYITHEE